MDRGSLITDKTYLIVGISKNQGITKPSIYINENELDEFEHKYSIYSLENKGYHGISVYSFNSDLFYEIENIGLSHDMPDSLFISQVSTFLNSTNSIILNDKFITYLSDCLSIYNIH